MKPQAISLLSFLLERNLGLPLRAFWDKCTVLFMNWRYNLRSSLIELALIGRWLALSFPWLLADYLFFLFRSSFALYSLMWSGHINLFSSLTAMIVLAPLYGFTLNLLVTSGLVIFGILFENFFYIILFVELLYYLSRLLVLTFLYHFCWSVRTKKENQDGLKHR